MVENHRTVGPLLPIQADCYLVGSVFVDAMRVGAQQSENIPHCGPIPIFKHGAFIVTRNPAGLILHMIRAGVEAA